MADGIDAGHVISEEEQKNEAKKLGGYEAMKWINNQNLTTSYPLNFDYVGRELGRWFLRPSSQLLPIDREFQDLTP
jgi:hypothetical protein